MSFSQKHIDSLKTRIASFDGIETKLGKQGVCWLIDQTEGFTRNINVTFNGESHRKLGQEVMQAIRKIKYSKETSVSLLKQFNKASGQEKIGMQTDIDLNRQDFYAMVYKDQTCHSTPDFVDLTVTDEDVQAIKAIKLPSVSMA